MWRVALRPVPSGASSTASRLGRVTQRWSTWACVDTPNPNVRKFEAATSAPVPSVPAAIKDRLLLLEGVRDVFIAHGAPGMEASVAPWVAVTRAHGASWEALAPRVQELLCQLPEEAGSNGAADLSGTEVDAVVVGARAAEGSAGGVEAEIEEVLEHRVRPSVQADGGDVELLRWDAASGEVLLRLRGACRGCPQSAVTLQEGILKTLKHFVPQVRTVVAEEEELSPEDLAADPCADLPWEHDGEADPGAIMNLAIAGTPFFSTFAGVRVEGTRLRRVRFISRIELAGRTPAHIIVKCVSCKARRSIEDPQDLLLPDKGNTTGNAAIVICPTCCVLISP